MRKLLVYILLLIGGNVLAQDSNSSTNSTSNGFSNEHLSSGEPEIYLYNNTEYTFTPMGMGFTITTMENGQEREYGQLRQTTDDGYFMLTTQDDEEASFGRFDEQGNFRALRLDEETDAVIEDNFIIQTPVESRNKQQVIRDTIN